MGVTLSPNIIVPFTRIRAISKTMSGSNLKNSSYHFYLYLNTGWNVYECSLGALVNNAFRDGQILRPWLQHLAVMKASDDTIMFSVGLVEVREVTAVSRGEYPLFV